MNIQNIINSKRTTIVGLLVGLASLLKASGVLNEETFGALAALIPHTIDAAAVIYLLLSKDHGK